jgi:lipoprotein-anchoring transpeptidase ErfK/SrfK
MQPFYYRSSRPNAKIDPAKPKARAKQRHHHGTTMAVLFLALVVVAAGIVNYSMGSTKVSAPAAPTSAPVSAKLPIAAAPIASTTTTTTIVNNCASNTLPQLVLVSISQRHLWACNGSTTVYDSPVVTGISYLAADLTPVGTYHVYAKQTNQVLTGCDTTGCWKDPVSYWMPFLDNQYGQYGFHDATWRAPSAFGQISPDSASASHGCVECPLSTAKWLYGWDHIGTAVTIES